MLACCFSLRSACVASWIHGSLIACEKVVSKAGAEEPPIKRLCVAPSVSGAATAATQEPAAPTPTAETMQQAEEPANSGGASSSASPGHLAHLQQQITTMSAQVNECYRIISEWDQSWQRQQARRQARWAAQEARELQRAQGYRWAWVQQEQVAPDTQAQACVQLCACVTTLVDVSGAIFTSGHSSMSEPSENQKLVFFPFCKIPVKAEDNLREPRTFLEVFIVAQNML